jgi:hypothetical protein
MKTIGRKIYGLRVYVNPRIRTFIWRSAARIYDSAGKAVRTGIWWWKRCTNGKGETVLYVDRPLHYAMFAAVHAHLPHVRIFPVSERAKSYLKRHSINYTMIEPYPEVIIMTDYYIRPQYPLRGMKAVQIFHGVGAKNYIDRSDNRSYLCLVPGRNLKERLESRGVSNIQIVGYPKTDCFFDGTLDRKHILNGMSLDPSRKTILYSPSWGILSSAPIAAEKINDLCDDYNVIVKLHDLSEPGWRDRYRRMDRIRFVEDANIAPYMFAADLMISDFSSTIFEYSQLLRPIITIVTDPEKARENAGDFSWWDITKKISDIDQLQAAADELLNGKWSPTPRYREVVDSIFSYRDGKSALRAAEAIREYEQRGAAWKR